MTPLNRRGVARWAALFVAILVLGVLGYLADKALVWITRTVFGKYRLGA